MDRAWAYFRPSQMLSRSMAASWEGIGLSTADNEVLQYSISMKGTGKMLQSITLTILRWSRCTQFWISAMNVLPVAGSGVIGILTATMLPSRLVALNTRANPPWPIHMLSV